MTRKKQLVRNIAAQLSLVLVTSLLIYCQEEKEMVERERERERVRVTDHLQLQLVIDRLIVSYL